MKRFSQIACRFVLIVSACRVATAEGDTSPASIPFSSEATVRVMASDRAAHPIPRHITGKFCEHLGSNIYQGMEAQIFRNPTFADWPFWTGQTTPDGVTSFHHERQTIAGQLKQQAARIGWPEGERDGLVEARDDALACWWIRQGPRSSVTPSPDTGPAGGRAQRIATSEPDQGIAQWVRLPLHRVRRYEYEIFGRSPDALALAVSLAAEDGREACSKTAAGKLGREWGKLRGTLEVDPGAPADAAYRFAVTADRPGQFVVARIVLYPADHVGGADRDVVRLLASSRLPLLRWPGGNFASGYRWEDGIGPVETRPTRPNFAWGGVEPNHFGTDEFIAFCRAVGCEPMICVNAGSGTPEEAARWIEYCNGPADSPMGRRRAAAGHTQPYQVRRWEVGNELWGKWQVHWTTAAGYVDRYRQFAKAMLAADPTIQLYSCGAPAMWGKAWNDTLIRGIGPTLATITDHPLIGGEVPAATDPIDVFRDFMAVPDVLATKWAGLQRDLREAGVKEPRLAVTELQMFARIGRAGDGAVARLTHASLVAPATLAEALYDVLIYHRAVRMAPFVELVTHSATVNHGGGLRKDREHVYASPCHYAQAMFAEMAGAVPVRVDVDSPKEHAPRVLPQLRSAASECTFQAIDVLSAMASDGGLLISLVHRGTNGPIRATIQLQGFDAGPRAELRTLSAELPWAANTFDSPETILPVGSSIPVRDGQLVLTIKPFSVVRVRIPTAK